MIKLENVTKKYNDFLAVNNISFDIKEGEIVGFLGKNGAGKTTTMNMITGYIEPTEGKIEINGYDINRNSKKAKSQIGYMPEGVPIYNDLTVKEFINYMADLKGVKRGYKQRVSMAGALVGKPKVLILDEPTVGLDPQQVKQIRDLIKSLRKDHTVLISSHILSEISQICEKVIIIDKGKILAVDTPENLEKKVNNQNILTITIEDEKNKINDIIKEIKDVKEIKLVTENSDGTKQYTIFVEQNKDIRKEVSEKFAKNEITILELKKTEATLEEAFLQLIDNYSKKEENNNYEKKGGKE